MRWASLEKQGRVAKRVGRAFQPSTGKTGKTGEMPVPLCPIFEQSIDRDWSGHFAGREIPYSSSFR
jgi:hypothetical protein